MYINFKNIAPSFFNNLCNLKQLYLQTKNQKNANTHRLRKIMDRCST